MGLETSQRFRSLPAYPLTGLVEARRRMEEEGVDLIDLSAGDADLAPPPAAVAALQESARDPAFSRYPFNVGLREFRRQIVLWMGRRFGLSLDPEREVLPLIGSKEGIAHLPFVFLDPGEVALLPDPGYPPYRGGVALAGGEPYTLPLRRQNGFLPDLGAVPASVLERARILYLNYPNNPTAAVASRDFLAEAVDYCHRHSLVLVYDNAYSELAFDGYRPPSVLELEGARDVALEFHSLSKTFNMTGWRLGWAAGSAELVGALAKVKSFVDTGAFLAVQAAGAAALRTAEDWVPANVAVFEARRDAAVAALTAVGFEVEVPRATMYLWIPVPAGEDSMSFARRSLEEEGVIVLPGRGMGEGGEGFFRVALTCSEARLQEAAVRLGRLLR